MRRSIRKILALLLAVTLLAAAMPVHAAAAGGTAKFSDVSASAWYGKYLDKVLQLPGIINGYPDGSFRPDDNVKRGEFLKMVICAAQLITSIYTTDKSRDKIHWAGKYYTMAKEDNLLVSDVFSGGVGGILFPCTAKELNQPISRYEMAAIISNIVTNSLMEQTVKTTDAFSNISDYDKIPDVFVSKVEQAYGKGILTGFEDSSFRGSGNLTRAQAVAVIERMLWDNDRLMPDWAEYPKVSSQTVTGNYLDPSQSFANWLHNGHVDSWGKLDSEARIRLFGDAGKSHFSSASEAAPYMETVTVPIWTIDKSGVKKASTTSITVNKAVAAEVRSIFQMIYDDPEQFPIYGGWSAGGARYTDTLRHSWGCAIDVNAYYNCECDFKGSGGSLRVTCGYGWMPIGHNDTTYIGSMDGPSAYSIGSNPNEYGYSVVKAFATYGWGWGGQGYSSGKHDFMHFSVMSSGG